jgi:hypothetical protein
MAIAVTQADEVFGSDTQMKGRLKLSDAERATLGEIGPRTKMGRSAMRSCISPIAAHRATRLSRTGTIPSTASIF